MRLDLVGRTMLDVNAAAIGFPSTNSRGKPFIGVRDAAVVLFLIFVLFGVGSRVAAKPELLDKLLALLVVGKTRESCALVVCDDIRHIAVDPIQVWRGEFLAKSLVAFL